MDTFSPQQRSRVMSRIRDRNTAPELLIRSLLYRLGYRFRLYRKDIPGTPDLVFPARRSVIFIHGCFWHGHDCSRGRLPTSNRSFWQQKIGRNKERDDRLHGQLLTEGWKVLTVWQCQTKDATEIKKTLIEFLGPSSRQHRGTTISE